MDISKNSENRRMARARAYRPSLIGENIDGAAGVSGIWRKEESGDGMAKISALI